MVAHELEKKNRTEDIAIEDGVTFATMMLPGFILDGLHSAGFKKPSPIQLVAIPLARCGLDLIVQAKSGTGKTLVFGITALESIDLNIKRAQVIVIAPTREIAFQIADVIKTIGRSMKGLRIGTFVGGRPTNSDKQDIRGCHIAVGCPGRLRHLIELNILDSKAVRLFILDEADKLFEKQYDYQRDLNYIFNNCGESKQVLALSATYPPELLEFTGKYMRDGKHVTPSGGPTPVLLGLRQMIVISKDHPDLNARIAIKEKELINILETVPFDQCCVFLNYATRAESINYLLQKKGFASMCLTGKQDMDTRIEAMANLKSGGCRVLVTTDVAARGIDASSVNLVINCGLPWDPATYLHRMGRAGRYGSHGICISIISNGIELENFRKMLGKIGGKSMSVNVIPRLRNVDLWTEDLANFDKIQGIVELNEEESLEEKIKNNFQTANELMQNDEAKEIIYLYDPDKTDEEVSACDNYKAESIETISLKAFEDELNNYLVETKPPTPIKPKPPTPEKPKLQTPRKSVPKKVLTYSEVVTNSRGKKSPRPQCPPKVSCRAIPLKVKALEANDKKVSAVVATNQIEPSCQIEKIVVSNYQNNVSKMLLDNKEKNVSARSYSLELKKFAESKEKKEKSSDDSIPPLENTTNGEKKVVTNGENRDDVMKPPVRRALRGREPVDAHASNKRKRNLTSESGTSADFDSYTYTIDSTDDYEALDEMSNASGVDLNCNDDELESLSVITYEDEEESEVDYPSEIFRCMESNYEEPEQSPPTDWFTVIHKQIHDYVVYSRQFMRTSEIQS